MNLQLAARVFQLAHNPFLQHLLFLAQPVLALPLQIKQVHRL